MKSYVIKVALHGVSPMIWRRLRIPGTLSLAQLHAVIQILYDWDDEYLHQFHIYGKDYGISYPGGIGFSDDARQVFWDDFGFDVGDKCTYEYNFYQHCLVDIRIEQCANIPLTEPIRCTQGNGMPGASKYDAMEATYKLLHALAHIDKATTVGELRPLVEALHAVKFNRRHMNHRLETELTTSIRYTNPSHVMKVGVNDEIQATTRH